jgi:uncharacterized LabA/DUF88 family protein
LKTAIFIDGFNLYYGCLKGSAFKWLDLMKLFQNVLMPTNEIVDIHYFTAQIKPKPADPQAPQRQQAYIRALMATTPELHVHYGHFLRHKVRMENAAPPPNTLEVMKTEEKGSDVNLAVNLLNSAWLDHFDCAVVVSNDSDMAEGMRLVKQHHPKKLLGLVTPGRSKTSQELRKHADFVRTIRSSALRRSQLPLTIKGTNLKKPRTW